MSKNKIAPVAALTDLIMKVETEGLPYFLARSQVVCDYELNEEQVEDLESRYDVT